MSILVDTAYGQARMELFRAKAGRAWLLLGHGAGGSTSSPDLVAAKQAALDAKVHVALVEQPYRVAGRRTPAPANQLDAAWLTVAAELRTRSKRLPIIFGGRSSGARVACRTSAAGKATAVLCLAFPVHPPGKAAQSRLSELRNVAVPTLVVQGKNDPFGRPKPSSHCEVVLLPGDHSLKADPDGLHRAVYDWLNRTLPSRGYI